MSQILASVTKRITKVSKKVVAPQTANTQQSKQPAPNKVQKSVKRK